MVIAAVQELHGVHLVDLGHVVHVDESALHLLICKQFHVVLVVLCNQHLLGVVHTQVVLLQRGLYCWILLCLGHWLLVMARELRTTCAGRGSPSRRRHTVCASPVDGVVRAACKYDVIEGVELVGALSIWLILSQLLLLIVLLMLTWDTIPATNAGDILQEHIVVLVSAKIALLGLLQTVILVLGHFGCD